MVIRLYNFVKKHNSTARPADSSVYIERNVSLKRNTSINAPTFILEMNEDVMKQNYLYIPSLHLYYYIDDIVLGNDNIIELVCKIDSLATAKPYIMASSAFVKYTSDSSLINEYLRDERIIASTDIETLLSTNNFGELVEYSENTYCWMLTTMSEDDGLCSYFVSALTIKYLTQSLTSAGAIGNILQMFGDAKNSLLDLHFVPFKLETLQSKGIVADYSSTIKLGSYNTGADGYVFNTYLYEIADVISIPSGTYTDFRRCSPYTEAKLYAPLIGCMDIALDEFADRNTISFKYVINLSNGNVSFILSKNGGDNVISTSSGNFTLQMPIVFQQYANAFNALAGAAIAVVGVASGGALSAAGLISGVASFASAFQKTTSALNSFGGNFSTSADRKMRLTVIKHKCSEEPSNLRVLYGRPCGKVLSLNNLAGYCQTSQFELASPLDDGIVQEVNRLMDAGVYLE